MEDDGQKLDDVQVPGVSAGGLMGTAHHRQGLAALPCCVHEAQVLPEHCADAKTTSASNKRSRIFVVQCVCKNTRLKKINNNTSGGAAATNNMTRLSPATRETDTGTLRLRLGTL